MTLYQKRFFFEFAQVLKKSFLHLVYPSRCLHCQDLLPPEPIVLCSACSSLLDLIEPQDRCLTCFNLLIQETRVCYDCLQYPSLYYRAASAFDYEGPAATLVKKLKYAGRPYLAGGMAAFFMLQFDRLGWPIPDAIVPVPISFTHWLERGYNQSALLAEEMGKLLNCPVWDILKRKSGDFSQAALTLEQRLKLDGHRFYLNSCHSLKGKTLFVIDDVMTSGLTLQRSAEVLNQDHPAFLYAMTFCKTQSNPLTL